MFIWIKSNMPTAIVCLLLLVATTAAVAKLINDKKNGRGCSGCCQGCLKKGSCHKNK